MAKTTIQDIDDFLAQKRIALVGVSRNPQEISRLLLREFVRRGYDVVPVNPNLAEVEGLRCFARIQDVAPAVDAVLIMTAAGRSTEAVQGCAEAHIKRAWLYRGAGAGAVSAEAVDLCQHHGIRVVAGFCPYMFWPETSFVHRAHKFAMKVAGSYPGRAA
jgi:predicted CoA-binding protein